MNTMKWYNLMDKAGIKSMSMVCNEESIRTRLASNLYDFAYDMWNASATIDRANEYREYLIKTLDITARTCYNIVKLVTAQKRRITMNEKVIYRLWRKYLAAARANTATECKKYMLSCLRANVFPPTASGLDFTGFVEALKDNIFETAVENEQEEIENEHE